MYHVRIKSELRERVDAEYYSPESLEADRKLREFGKKQTLGQLIESGYRVIYHGIDNVDYLRDSETVLFLSPTNIDDEGSFNFEELTKVPKYYLTKYPKGIAQKGDLLIEVKGNVSKLAVIPDIFPEGLMVSGWLPDTFI